MLKSPTTELGGLLRGGAAKSLASMLIKVATAGLTFLMFVVLSRLMGDAPYGEFALGLSLATMLAVLAGVGQQTAILRVWPEESVGGRPEKAEAALRSGAALTLAAAAVVTLGALLVSLALGLAGGGIGSVAYLLAAALLILPMAQAEYASSALRAQGSVWTALAARDLVWRIAVCVAVGAFFLAQVHLTGAAALGLAALLLVLVLFGQAWLASRRGYRIAPGFAGIRSYWGERGTASRWFLLAAILDTAALNADTVIVGLMVTHEAAGIYFNAFRTAGLMTLFLFASTLVIAPMVARTFHSGDLRKTQAVLGLSASTGFGFSLLMFAMFAAFGGPILSVFGQGYEQGYPVLIILSLGLLVDAATGSSRTTMMMTGHERSYVLIFGAATLAGIVLQFAMIPFYGLIGAAVVNAVARAVSQLAVAWWCITRVGLDPTILGLLRINRLRQSALS